MMQSVRRLLCKSTRAISALISLARDRDFLLILNWHQITPRFDPKLHHRYTWTEFKHFASTIDYLVRHFRVVSLSETLKRIKNGNLEGRCVALTFDDGDIS